ncbi:MAG: hydroxyacid dehydrogenase [Alphaproteobacteria bacterium]|nr:hydroxyacid dehydrogenase [Alphaproteobacteria bacterium]
MTANAHRVFYFNFVQHQAFLDVLGARADISVQKLLYSDPFEQSFAAMQGAHAYQATSVRDDLPRPYFVTAEFLQRVPSLLIVSTNGAGYDTIDVPACTAAGVLVVNQQGGNKEGVAEHALAMMLGVSKRLYESDRLMRRGAVKRRNDLIGNDLLGKTVGIIGLGNIGSRLAEIVKLGFRCRVLACDPYLSETQCAARGAEKVALDDLLAQSDFVSVHCPHNAETAGMIGAREFALMRKGAFFVNTARFGIHDEEALHAALLSGHLGGAGLDVWLKEPPPADHPLLALDTVIGSPHVAGVTQESREKVAIFAAEQLIGLFDGGRPPRLINPEAWPAYRERYRATFGRAPAP